MKYIDIKVTREMIEYANSISDEVKVNRTVASPIDTLTGLVGELAFGQWFLGDWREHDALTTKGKADFADRIEVKTSVYPFSSNLNLLVREDYAEKRRPDYYVQVIIDAPHSNVHSLEPGWNSRISGWATAENVDAAPLRDFGSKGGGRGGYRCRYIPIRSLNPMSTFPIGTRSQSATAASTLRRGI